MGGNQADFDHQQQRNKKQRKREYMENSDEWKQVKLDFLFAGEKMIWVKSDEAKDVIETFIREQYGMHSWFEMASKKAVEQTVYTLLNDQPWIDEVRWSKP